MKIINNKTIPKFWEHHSNAKEPLLAWYREIEQEDLDTPTKECSYRQCAHIPSKTP